MEILFDNLICPVDSTAMYRKTVEGKFPYLNSVSLVLFIMFFPPHWERIYIKKILLANEIAFISMYIRNTL